ncbi:hypothetical protein Tco_0829541 [Tanacetum coccineum]
MLGVVVGMLEGMVGIKAGISGIKESLLQMVLFKQLLGMLKMCKGIFKPQLMLEKLQLFSAIIMLLAAKDEAIVHLDNEESDLMLMSANGDDQLDSLLGLKSVNY